MLNRRQFVYGTMAGLVTVARGASGFAQGHDLVITGGRWRYRNDDPDVRNHYLIVEARGSDGLLINISRSRGPA